MSAPTKPWETLANNQDATSFIHSSEPIAPLMRSVPRLSSAPPLPPRSRHGISFSGGHFSRYPYGMGSYGGMYGGYGGSYGLSPYAMRNTDFENRYVQMVEESAAPAFESIDSFVRGFSSVTMMLESTLQAMHLSFRTILGVAENMSRMKTAMFEFLSAMAILKTIYSFYRKILYFLGLVNGADVSWKEAEAAVSGRTARKSYWPMLGFLAVMIGGPTLISRYLLPDNAPDDDELDIVGMYDFDGEQPGELSFNKGDRMKVKKSGLKKGWLMATKGTSKGLIPYNRVAIVKKKLAGGTPVVQTVTANGPLRITPAPAALLSSAPAAPMTRASAALMTTAPAALITTPPELLQPAPPESVPTSVSTDDEAVSSPTESTE